MHRVNIVCSRCHDFSTKLNPHYVINLFHGGEGRGGEACLTTGVLMIPPNSASKHIPSLGY